MSESDKLNLWLMSEGRMLGDPLALIEAYVQRLQAAGLSLIRVNLNQRVANPLFVAWGTIWTPEETTRYEILRDVLDTPAFIGSPIEHLLNNRRPVRQRLTNLDPAKDHSAYIDRAEDGGTDFYADILEYSDDTVQACTYVTDHPDGFTDSQIALIHDTRNGLAAAMEPMSHMENTASLLRTYIGRGPAGAVVDGTILRGERTEIEAVVLFSDLRGFTAMTEQEDEPTLLAVLDRYFEAVVAAVDANGGDVLKFLGDGILSIFPIEEGTTGVSQCGNAVKAAFEAQTAITSWSEERVAAGLSPVRMGIGINRGTVTYGNIGSPARLDFTVLGSAVNTASRVQDLCKALDEPILVTASVTSADGFGFSELGQHQLRGIVNPVAVYRPEA